ASISDGGIFLSVPCQTSGGNGIQTSPHGARGGGGLSLRAGDGRDGAVDSGAIADHSHVAAAAGVCGSATVVVSMQGTGTGGHVSVPAAAGRGDVLLAAATRGAGARGAGYLFAQAESCRTTHA